MNLVKNFNKKKSLILKKINIYNLTFILLIFILDRLSKNKIINNFSEKTHFINDFINLDLIWNTGIGFGLLSSDLPIIYNLVTILIGIVILVLFYFSIISEESDKLIFSIIIGGALGNFYDRIFYNAVPDFIDLHYQNFHWFIFNVSDIFITLGIIAFLMKGFFIKN